MPQPVRAAEIVKATSKAVLIKFEPLDENFVTGDKLLTLENGVQHGLLEVTKIKDGRLIAQILNGHASVGMTVQRFGVVGDAKATPTTSNLESVIIRFISTGVFRGIPLYRPVLMGAVLIGNSGPTGGVAILNQSLPATSEYDYWVGYAFNRLNWSLSPTISREVYFGNRNTDVWVIKLDVTYRILTLDLQYMPRFYGSKSDDMYYKLSSLIGLGQRWKVACSVGYQKFSNEQSIGWKNYLDYKIGPVYSMPEFAVEFDWTTTNRRNLAGQPYPDESAAVVISKQF